MFIYTYIVYPDPDISDFVDSNFYPTALQVPVLKS